MRCAFAFILMLSALTLLGQGWTMRDAPFLGAAQTVSAHVNTLTNGIVAYWKMDEASAGNRADIGAQTLVQNGTIDSGPGLIGNATIWTNQPANYFTLADNSTNSVGSGVDFTISLWVSMETTNVSNKRVWMKGDSDNATKEYWISYTTAAGFNSFFFSIADGTTKYDVFSQTKFQTNTWVHVVAWCDAAAGDIFIRVNNTATYTNASASYIADTTKTTYVGQLGGGSSSLQGKLDEVGMWKRILTAAEISELYNGGAGKQYPFDP